MRRLLPTLLLLSACATGEGGPSTSRTPDGGSPPMDAATDTGPGDAAAPDAGPGDAGPTDTGPADTGPMDVGPDCRPTAESCNGVDDDCDGFVDDNLVRACSDACGAGTETCEAGAWVRCTAAPGVETCDGTDEDCDGRTDESLSRACSSACGAGTETCSAGSWVGCDAPLPATETCNGADDDCDGSTDEALAADVFDPVPMSELTERQPPCDGPGASLDVCMSAASRWCTNRSTACYVSGAGHLQATATTARIACFGRLAERRNGVTRADVSAASGITIDDTNIRLRVAQSAVNRYCRANGFEAGVGPVEHSDPIMNVVCLPATVASYEPIATTELTSRGCDPVATDPSTLVCSSAADGYCRAAGFVGGFGPVEWNATSSSVVCFRD